MKNSKITTFLVTAVCMAVPTLFTSCNSCCNGNDITTVEKVALYYLKDDAPAEQQGNIDAYFDFSDGMNAAYQNDTTKDMLKNIVNKVSGEESSRVFSMAENTITQLSQKTTELFNSIMDSKSYSKQFAPIEKTLEKIVTDNNNALLVTDFEEYTPDGRVQTAAFASKYFKQWLSRGGDITFFITNYKENKLSKHLYFVIFSKRDHILIGKIRDALKGIPKNYQTYLLSTNPCMLMTKYPGAAYGGEYRDEAGDPVVTATYMDTNDPGESYYNYNISGVTPVLLDSRYFKSVPVMNAEYYSFGVSWSDAINNAAAMRQGGVPVKYTHLLRKLFVNLTQQDSYKVETMDVVATDVQADMDAYINYIQAINCKPQMVPDGEGGMVADLKDGAENYYDEKGNMLPGVKYQPKPTPQIMDMFVLDQQLFSSTKAKDPSRAEIGIDFKPGFSGNIIGFTKGDMLRLDVVIAECEPNTGRLQELFAWSGNSNLFDAIKNTLQELNPKGRVVYSYFIKTE